MPGCLENNYYFPSLIFVKEKKQENKIGNWGHSTWAIAVNIEKQMIVVLQVVLPFTMTANES